MSSDYTIRKAVRGDLDTLVEFTLQEARDAEGIDLDVSGVRRGVAAAFDDPPLAEYWVAEATDGRVVGSASLVKEWSNFRGGYYWWLQSLFIVREHRGRGLVDLLLNHVRQTAHAAGALDFRLYAHNANERAIRVYRRFGFKVAPYTLMTASE